GSTLTSNTIVVNGIAKGAAISVTGGEYSINGGAYTTAPGTIDSGQSVTLRLVASGNCNTTATMTVTIAGLGDRSFSVTTIACNTTPADPGVFLVQANVDPGTVRTSNTLYVTATNTPIPISIVGGEYSIGCNGSFTSAAGTIAPDTHVCVRQAA